MTTEVEVVIPSVINELLGVFILLSKTDAYVPDVCEAGMTSRPIIVEPDEVLLAVGDRLYMIVMKDGYTYLPEPYFAFCMEVVIFGETRFLPDVVLDETD